MTIQRFIKTGGAALAATALIWATLVATDYLPSTEGLATSPSDIEDYSKEVKGPLPATSPLITPVDGVATVNRESQQILTELSEDQIFEAEPVDSAWASPIEAAIYARIADSGLGLTIFQAECRSSSCRIILTLSRNAADLQEFHESSMLMSEVAKSWVEEHRPDVLGVKTAAFMEGSDFPTLPTAKIYLYRSREGNGFVSCGPRDQATGPAAIPREFFDMSGPLALCHYRKH